MNSTAESRYIKTGNSMVGNEDDGESVSWELTDDGELSLRVDLAYMLNHEFIEEMDGIENAAIYLKDKLQSDDEGLFLVLRKTQTRSGDMETLYYTGSEVYEV